ncbi:hypothetical protein CKAH01_06498 [Colletotrichum kahawae]|uniref:Uncharacterized protein n=1 Tax=Colletotrichum kahawae TaxID=34407 RepID=A0AAD9Y9Q7_COLKA|nr:hypothetical protein CKAH01_06498 [Colletotrichum kahawae]
MQLLHCRIAKPPSGADFPSNLCRILAVLPPTSRPPPANGGGGQSCAAQAHPAPYLGNTRLLPPPPIPAFHLLALRPSKPPSLPQHVPPPRNSLLTI